MCDHVYRPYYIFDIHLYFFVGLIVLSHTLFMNCCSSTSVDLSCLICTLSLRRTQFFQCFQLLQFSRCLRCSSFSQAFQCSHASGALNLLVLLLSLHFLLNLLVLLLLPLQSYVMKIEKKSPKRLFSPQDYYSKGPERHKVQFGLRPQACEHLLRLLRAPLGCLISKQETHFAHWCWQSCPFVHSGVVQPSLPGDGWDRLTGEQSPSPTGFHPALLPIWIHRYLDSPSWGGARPSWRGESILFWSDSLLDFYSSSSSIQTLLHMWMLTLFHIKRNV